MEQSNPPDPAHAEPPPAPLPAPALAPAPAPAPARGLAPLTRPDSVRKSKRSRRSGPRKSDDSNAAVVDEAPAGVPSDRCAPNCPLPSSDGRGPAGVTAVTRRAGYMADMPHDGSRGPGSRSPSP